MCYVKDFEISLALGNETRVVSSLRVIRVCVRGSCKMFDWKYEFIMHK